MMNLLLLTSEITSELPVESIEETTTWIQDVIHYLATLWEKFEVWIPTTGVTIFTMMIFIVRYIYLINKSRIKLKELKNQERQLENQKLVESNAKTTEELKEVLLKYLPIIKLLIESSFNEEFKQKCNVLYKEVVTALENIKISATPVVETIKNTIDNVVDTTKELVQELKEVDQAPTELTNILFTGE